MYSILISAAVALAVILVWGLASLPGGWGLGVFLGLVAMVAVWIFIARRLRTRIEPGFKLAQKQAEAGKLQQAMHALEEMLPLGKWMPILTGQLHTQIGLFAHHSQDSKKAIEHLSKGSKRSPEGQMLLATIHYNAGDAERASAVLDKALPYNRKSVLLHHFYAWILHREGNAGKGIAVLNQLLQKLKADPATKDNLLRLQNGSKMNMTQFGMPWFALGFERPPQSMGQVQQGRKGFRQAPKSQARKKQKGKRKRKS